MPLKVDLALGKLAVNEELVSKATLQATLEEQRHHETQGKYYPLGDFLTQMENLSSEQMTELLGKLRGKIRLRSAELYGQQLVTQNATNAVSLRSAMRGVRREFGKGEDNPLALLDFLVTTGGLAAEQRDLLGKQLRSLSDAFVAIADYGDMVDPKLGAAEQTLRIAYQRGMLADADAFTALWLSSSKPEASMDDLLIGAGLLEARQLKQVEAILARHLEEAEDADEDMEISGGTVSTPEVVPDRPEIRTEDDGFQMASVDEVLGDPGNIAIPDDLFKAQSLSEALGTPETAEVTESPPAPEPGPIVAAEPSEIDPSEIDPADFNIPGDLFEHAPQELDSLTPIEAEPAERPAPATADLEIPDGLFEPPPAAVVAPPAPAPSAGIPDDLFTPSGDPQSKPQHMTIPGGLFDLPGNDDEAVPDLAPPTMLHTPGLPVFSAEDEVETVRGGKASSSLPGKSNSPRFSPPPQLGSPGRASSAVRRNTPSPSASDVRRRRHRPSSVRSGSTTPILIGAGACLVLVIVIAVLIIGGGEDDGGGETTGKTTSTSVTGGGSTGKTTGNATGQPVGASPAEVLGKLKTQIEGRISDALAADDLPRARAAANEFSAKVEELKGGVDWEETAMSLEKPINEYENSRYDRLIEKFKDMQGEDGKTAELQRLLAEIKKITPENQKDQWKFLEADLEMYKQRQGGG